MAPRAAAVVLGRALGEVLTAAPFRLVSPLDGGGSWNAIAGEATAMCSLPPKRETDFRGGGDRDFLPELRIESAAWVLVDLEC